MKKYYWLLAALLVLQHPAHSQDEKMDQLIQEVTQEIGRQGALFVTSMISRDGQYELPPILILGMEPDLSEELVQNMLSSFPQDFLAINGLNKSLKTQGEWTRLSTVPDTTLSFTDYLKRSHQRKRDISQLLSSEDQRAAVILTSLQQGQEGCDSYGEGTLATYLDAYAKSRGREAINIGLLSGQNENLHFLKEILKEPHSYLLHVEPLRKHVIAGKLREAGNTFLLMVLKYDYILAEGNSIEAAKK